MFYLINPVQKLDIPTWYMYWFTAQSWKLYLYQSISGNCTFKCAISHQYLDVCFCNSVATSLASVSLHGSKN